MAESSHQCRVLSVLAFELSKHRLGAADFELVRDYMYEHNEWGLGVETLVDIIVNEDIAVTLKEKEAICAAMNAMQLRRSQEKIRVVKKLPSSQGAT